MPSVPTPSMMVIPVQVLYFISFDRLCLSRNVSSCAAGRTDADDGTPLLKSHLRSMLPAPYAFHPGPAAALIWQPAACIARPCWVTDRLGEYPQVVTNHKFITDAFQSQATLPNLKAEFRSPSPTQCAAVAVRSPNRNQTPAPLSPMLLAVPAMLMGFNFVLINRDLLPFFPMRECYNF